ncbi:MAG TPA: hypothetical protein VKR06_06315 [Ktedonosporobacter sp.]|nr:hypothetical protein [Ktedonosporobacter sp.]
MLETIREYGLECAEEEVVLPPQEKILEFLYAMLYTDTHPVMSAMIPLALSTGIRQGEPLALT